jgi:hypothetical protein
VRRRRRRRWMWRRRMRCAAAVRVYSFVIKAVEEEDAYDTYRNICMYTYIHTCCAAAEIFRNSQ